MPTPTRPKGKLRSVKKKGVSLSGSEADVSNGQRRLYGYSKKSLSNPYDELNPESTENPHIKLSQPKDALPDISPRRKDKQRQPKDEPTKRKSGALDSLKERRKTRSQLAVPVSDSQQQSPEKTPRRSPRKHGTNGVSPGTPSSGKGLRSTRSTPRHHEVAEEETNNDGLDAEEGEPKEASGEEGEEVAATTNSSDLPTQTPQKRGRGRPRKLQSNGLGRPPRNNAPDSAPKSASHGVPRGSENVTEKLRPEIPRVSLPSFPDADDKDDLEDTVVGDEAAVLRPQTKKRKASQDPPQAFTSAGKRAKRATEPDEESGDQEEEEDKDEEEEGPGSGEQAEAERSEDDEQIIDSRRLFGQGSKLESILKNIRRSEKKPEQPSIPLKDDDVVALHRLCDEATASLEQLLAGEEGDESSGDPPAEFDQIDERIRGLCGRSTTFQTDFDNKRKVKQIYFHLIPRLFKLLKYTVDIFEEVDDKAPPATVTISHLRYITAFMSSIIDLGDAARTKYAKASSRHPFKQRVLHGIIAPLKSIGRVLDRCLHNMEQDEINATERAREAAETARQRREEEEQRARIEEENRIKTEWRSLHVERRNVVTLVQLALQGDHFWMPNAPVELDQNGQSFERLPVFRHRVGPHPVNVAEARQHVWSIEEIDALQEGLRRYAGRHVFQNIFRKYCGRKGALNKYNVTEIVTNAADLKELLEEEQMKAYGEVEKWVQDIPVWTNIQTMLGQENATTTEQ